MKNEILIGILIVVVVIAVCTLIKRAGRKGCCGSGSDVAPRKKKLKHVIAVKTFRVEGMHCQKCSNRVMEAVNDIPDAAGIVDLKKGLLTVSYQQEVADEVILAKLERLGYPAAPVSQG